MSQLEEYRNLVKNYDGYYFCCTDEWCKNNEYDLKKDLLELNNFNGDLSEGDIISRVLERDHYDLALSFIKMGLGIEYIDSVYEYTTLLYKNVECGNCDVVNELLELGANPNVKGAFNPLFAAIDGRNIDCLDSLLNNGANPNSVDLYSEFGNCGVEYTPLTRELNSKDYNSSIFFKLFLAGADINKLTNGKPPLYYCSTIQAVDDLLNINPNSSTLDNNGDSILPLIKNKNPEIYNHIVTRQNHQL